jgi:dihydrofolate reductase
MTKVVLDIQISLDGFIAGINDSADNPAGEGGEALFSWMYPESGEVSAENKKVMDELLSRTGAVIAGVRTYKMVNGWAGEPLVAPYVILCEAEPTEKLGDEPEKFSFVHSAEDAVAKAKEIAGDKDIHLLGGAKTAQSLLKAGLVDEIQLHISPVLLGDGVRLFDHIPVAKLRKTRVIDTPEATHVQYDVIR